MKYKFYFIRNAYYTDIINMGFTNNGYDEFVGSYILLDIENMIFIHTDNSNVFHRFVIELDELKQVIRSRKLNKILK